MDKTTVYNKSIDKWGRAGGIGTISYDRSLDLFEPIKFILNRFFSHDPNNKAIVVVSSPVRIDEWTTHIVKDFDHVDKIGSDKLRIITADNIILHNLKYDCDLLIIDQVEKFASGKRLDILKRIYINFKYIIGVTNSPDPDNDGFGLYEYCPVIDRVTKVDVVTHGIVGDTLEIDIPVSMSEADTKLYEEMNEYIKDTIDLFGSFEMVMNCYHGDAKAGISADYYRQELAASKGWHKDIDTSSQYYANIDRYYNPNSIYERAQAFSEVITRRIKLLSDNSAKVQAVVDIVAKHKDKKILIISKRSAFARVLNNAINERIKGVELKKDIPQATLFKPVDKLDGYTIQSSVMCVEYHPDVESRPLVDIETNDWVRYKSGINQGKVKQFGAASLNKIANKRFQEGYHNVMSASNAIPKDADLLIDFIIITSPECETLNHFQYRVHRLDFKDTVKIVNIYLDNTKEVTKLKERHSLTKNTVIQVQLNDVDTLNL